MSRTEIDWDVPRWTVPPEAENHHLKIRAHWVGYDGLLFEQVTEWEIRGGLLIGKATDRSSVLGSVGSWDNAARSAQPAVTVDWGKPIVEFGPNFWPFPYSSSDFTVSWRINERGVLREWPEKWASSKRFTFFIGTATDGSYFVAEPQGYGLARKRVDR